MPPDIYPFSPGVLGPPEYGKNMVIIFYTLTDSHNRLTKTLNNGVSLDCSMHRDVDIYDPVLRLKNYNNAWDYLSWDNRYYFIRDKRLIAVNLYEIVCHIDALMTYRDILLQSQVYLQQTTKTEPYFDGGDYNHLETYETDIYRSDITLPRVESTILITVGLSGDTA